MLGVRLAESRKRAGWSQHQLAIELGGRYDQSVISAVENKRSSLRLTGAVKAAQVLDVSLDYLLGLTDDPTPVDDRREELEAALQRVRAQAQRSEEELERLRAQAAADSPADNILVFPGGWSGVSDSKGPTASRLVDVLQLAAAAGGGSFELDEKVVGRASFPYDWLNSKGLDPARCSVIGVVGDSMEPTLTDGCSILVNRATRRRRVGKLYVLLTGYEGLVVKRAGKDEDGTWLLMSDSEAYPPVPWGDDDTLIGEVKSATRTAWVGV